VLLRQVDDEVQTVRNLNMAEARIIREQNTRHCEERRTEVTLEERSKVNKLI
jgi:hypothetical protein